MSIHQYICLYCSNINLIHITIAKDRALKASKEECLTRWNENIFFSQTKLLLQFIVKLLDSIGLDNSLVTNFIEFVLRYKDNTKYFNC